MSVVSIEEQSFIVEVKAGSHNDAKPSVASMRCIVNKICFHQRLETQRNARTGSDNSDLIFASAALHFTNRFSEFYHNRTDAMQSFASLCKPSLTVKRSSANITKTDVL